MVPVVRTGKLVGILTPSCLCKNVMEED
jgi:hypothetical protein